MQRNNIPRYPDELTPDGVRIHVPWRRLEIGDSVFIPCLHMHRARMQIAEAADVHGLTVTTRIRIEAGCLGLRMWRTA